MPFFHFEAFCSANFGSIKISTSKWHLLLGSISWHGVRRGINQVDTASSRWTLQALRYTGKSLQAPAVNIHQLCKHSTWSIGSNHRQWIGLLQEIFINVLNSSNRNVNLSSGGRSTKSKRRKMRNIQQCFCWSCDSCRRRYCVSQPELATNI